MIKFNTYQPFSSAALKWSTARRNDLPETDPSRHPSAFTWPAFTLVVVRRSRGNGVSRRKTPFNKIPKHFSRAGSKKILPRQEFGIASLREFAAFDDFRIVIVFLNWLQEILF